MNFGTVLYESKDRVATITLNRPEHFNAISETMPEDIATAFGYTNKRSGLSNVRKKWALNRPLLNVTRANLFRAVKIEFKTFKAQKG